MSRPRRGALALLLVLLVSSAMAAPQTPTSSDEPSTSSSSSSTEGVPEKQDNAEALLLTTVVAPSSDGAPASTKAPTDSTDVVVDGGVSSSSPQPATIENSQPPDVSSSPSSPSSSPSEDVSSTLSTGLPSASLIPPLIAQAPLMASRTIVSSGQTPATTQSGTTPAPPPPTSVDTQTEAASVTVEEAANPAPTKEESTEVPSTEPDTATTAAPVTAATAANASPAAAAAAAAAATATVGSSAAPDGDLVEDKKPAGDLEPESETPVFSFGIRLFTVEVVTGTERASDEQIEPTNGTQAENFTHEGVVPNAPESTPLHRNPDGQETADTTSSPPSSVAGDDVELKVSEGSDGASGQESSATINTQVAEQEEVDPAPQDANPLLEEVEKDDAHQGDAFSNEIHVERNLKNGLYRIKIAEITTDEFDNGLRENDNENMLLTDSMGGRMHLLAAQQQQQQPPPPLHKSIYPSKINIDDFYPSKMEDFKGQGQQQQQEPEPALDNTLQESEAEKLQREKELLRNDDSEKLFESTIMKPSDMLPVLTVTELDVKALADGMDKPFNVGTVTSASSSAISSSPVSPASSSNTTGAGDGSDISTTKIEIELIDDTSETSASDERGTSSSSSSSRPTIDNITEKLEENDEVISRIEENFKGFRPFEGTVAGDDADDAMEYRDGIPGAVPSTDDVEPGKDDEVITIAISSVTFSSSQQDLTQTQTPGTPGVTSTVAGQNEEDGMMMMGIPVSGSDIVKTGYGGSSLFIPRRVKKNDPSTSASKLALLAASQTQAPLKRIDFAATKFNTDNSGPGMGGGGGSGHNMTVGPGGKKDKPEFSTTKFYNSKELYSELHHQPVVPVASPLNRTGLGQPAAGASGKSGKPPNAAILSEKDIISAKSAQSMGGAGGSRKPISRQPATGPGGNIPRSELKQHTLKTNFVLNEEPETVVLVAPKPSFNSVTSGGSEQQDQQQQQQRKIKSLGSAASAIIAATAKLAKPANRPSPLMMTTTTTSAATTTTTAAAATRNGQPVVQAAEHLITRPTGAPLSRLHEKINTLDCEIQTVAPDSSVWRGNETHELELPVTTPEDCSAGSSCTPTTISWEGTADIQSGDVLIVEIDDQHLIPSNYNKSSEGAHHSTATVYQVTRLGHENCDITEGVLLDITPLVADGKKLVTLYDKDLTEGINLLIVVSEQWGQQCVRLKVTVKSDNCGENADCSGKGVCYSNNSMEGYECQCCSGFAGTHCEEIDACSPSPCTNNGICVDLSQGHEGNAYQCLCPYGYTGKNCQFESDPCNPSQCLNGGTCVGNSTHFRCDCTSGYTGPLCQHNLNECESSPCVHGICVDQEDGFRCFCQPGFSGELCNFEYNECESNPCINGGQCIDNIGGFSCKCTRGYTGKRCHIKVDFCANDPCPDGHRCIDHGDDFTCECPGGRNGPDCNQVPRTLCNVNPCANGGTCWTTEESFYCACRPGFTGKMCEENFVIDTMVSSSEMLSDTLANQNGLRAISGSTMYGEGDGLVTTHGGTGGKHSSAIELHNAYIAAGTLATAILIVAIVVTACHCKVHQSYRHFATKHRQLIPVFGRRSKPANANRHWLSGKGHQQQQHQHQQQQQHHHHLPHQSHTNPNYNYGHQLPNSYAGMQPERIINKPLPMNLENDMYYTVDFGDSQNAPLIQ